MKAIPMVLIASAIALSFPMGVINAADQTQKQDQSKQTVQTQNQKMIYGYDLMSPKERNEHREKMMSMRTEQERTAYREEHHKLMQQRAREKGVEIPDAPMMRGTGPGFGSGQGIGGGGGGGGRGR